MTELYAKEEDVAKRLESGYIRYKGEWYIIYNHLGWMIQIKNLLTEAVIIIDVRLEEQDLDLSRPRIGFFNINGRTYYASVNPARQFQQSLTAHLISFFDIYKKEYSGINIQKYSLKTIEAGLSGKYPNFQETLLKMEKTDSYAFTRCFALSTGNSNTKYDLYHGMQIVGVYDKEIERIVLEDTFKEPHVEQLLTKYGCILK